MGGACGVSAGDRGPVRIAAIVCLILWGTSTLEDLARRKTIPRPPECPDCRPAIRQALAT